MRIFALLLLCLSAAAYSARNTTPSQAPACAAAPDRETAKILFQSTDGGKSWQDLSLWLPENMAVTSIFARDGEVFLGSENSGLYHSLHPELGAWEREDIGGVFSNYGGVFQNGLIKGIFPGRSGVYVTVHQDGFLRKKTNGSWQSMSENLKDRDVNAVLENADGSLIAACGTGIYKTTDDGKTWNRVHGGDWIYNLTAMGDVCVASGTQGLLRSADRGEHWTYVLSEEGVVYNTCVIDRRFAAVRVASPKRSCSAAVPLRTSADGETWQCMEQDLSVFENISDLQQAGEYLFCSHKAGISRSEDSGKTWELVYPSADPEKSLRFDLAVCGQTVYVVVMPGGC